MNAELKQRKHFTIAIDWNTRTLEQWLEQYGSWLLLDNRPVNLGAKSMLGQIIDAENGVAVDYRRRALPRCNITVHEAMAIEDLLAHAKETEGKKVHQWLKVVVMYFIQGLSEEDISTKLDMTMYSVKRDKMMGVLRIASRFKMRSYLTD